MFPAVLRAAQGNTQRQGLNPGPEDEKPVLQPCPIITEKLSIKY